MSRLRLSVLLLATSCGSTTGSGFKALVEYHLNAEADACIRVRASPQVPSGQTKENSFSLKGKPKDGSAKFGILIGEDWSGDITVTATLHNPCSAMVVLARDSKQQKAPVRGAVAELNLRLTEPALDSGVDGGGTDAGEDAGLDAGDDGGTDAGDDAGVDGGDDGGVDAGPIICDGGIGYLVGPPQMGNTWHDVALYPLNGVWLAGSGGLFFKSGSSWVAAGANCGGEHHAAWARPDGRVYFGTNDAGLRSSDPMPGVACQPLPIPDGGPLGDVYGITGFVDAGTVILYSATLNGTVVRNTEPTLTGFDRRWDLQDAGVRELWTIAGFDESALFAGGLGQSGNDGIILKYDPANDRWVREVVTIPETVNDITVVSRTLAFAGTEGRDLFIWDGTSWSAANNNMFGKAIYGLKAFSPTAVYAVGEDSVFKLWNGTTWTQLGIFDGGTNGFLSRVRGLSSCDLWSAGTTGLVVHSQ